MDLNKKNIRTILGIIIFTVLFMAIVNNFHAVTKVFGIVLNITLPFIVGASIAFVINVPMSFFEKNIFGRIKFLKKVKRGLSLVFTLVVLVLVVMLVGWLVVPEVISTMTSIVKGIPVAAEKAVEFVKKLGNDNKHIIKWIEEFSIDWQSYLSGFVDILRSGAEGLLSSTFNIVSGTIGFIYDAFVAVIFAIYILLQKEKLSVQGKKLIYAFVPEKVADRGVYILHLSYKTFRNFVTGQCSEAIILGLMFFIVLTILNMPYTVLISVLIAVTALIPIFGAFIGCFIGAFLILFINPVQALWFVIVFLVLQQIEGNLIYPNVVGSSVGLPSIWVLMAVTVGGSLMGIAGMLIFIPIASVMYALLRENIYHRLDKKQYSEDKWKMIEDEDKENKPKKEKKSKKTKESVEDETEDQRE